MATGYLVSLGADGILSIGDTINATPVTFTEDGAAIATGSWQWTGVWSGNGQSYAGVVDTGVYWLGTDGNTYFIPDTWTTSSGTATVTAALDGTIEGTSGDDTIDGAYAGDPGGESPGGGADNIIAGGGNDTVHAGLGNDTIDGGAGNDSLLGETGDDTITGGDGNDIIRGDEGAGAGRAVFQWSGLADPDDGGQIDGDDLLTGAQTQDTGGTTVSYSYDPNPTAFPDGTGGTDTPVTYANIENVTTGIDSGSTAVDTDSSLWIGGDLASSMAVLDFGDEVTNVAFRVNDIDSNPGGFTDRVTILAYDEAGSAVPVTLTPGSNLTLNAATNQVTSNGGIFTAADLEASVLVNISGPVARIEIIYSDLQTTGDDGLVNVTDVWFDEVAEPAGNDSLSGGVGNDTLFGDAGDDILQGDADDDTLFGGLGGDTLDGGTGADSLSGDAGSDIIDGGAGTDTISGGDATDTITGGAGSDSITGDANDDLIYGDGFTVDTSGGNLIQNGDFEDITGLTATAYGYVGAGTIPGWTAAVPGDDIDLHNDGKGGITGSDGANMLESAGSPTNLDVYQDITGLTAGETYQLTLDAGDADGDNDSQVEVYFGGQLVGIIDPANANALESFRFDLVAGSGDGSDRLRIAEVGNSDNDGMMIDNVQLFPVVQAAGGAGDDISGGTGDDVIFGETGNDTVSGDDGADSLYGGSGSDLLDGGDDIDTLFGGAGNDLLDGGADLSGGADDTLFGGDGNDILIETATDTQSNDTLFGGAGNDTLFSNTGVDTLYGGADEDTLVVSDTSGADLIEGGEGGSDYDVLDGSGLTLDTTVTMGAPEAGTLTRNSEVVNFSEIEEIRTGSGDDSIAGSIGNDTIQSGAGSDTVDAGAGDDVIDLGAGSPDGDPDLLIFADGDGSDIITGFNAPTPDGDGTFTGIDLLDVTDLADLDGNPVNTHDVTVTPDGSGNAVLTFPGGETLTLIGIPATDADDPHYLNAIGIPMADGTVEGTAGADTIDDSYLGDPDGDRVDADDAIILSDSQNDDLIFGYGGNDSITAGDGVDEVYGGTGDDVIDGGAGADEIFGGDDADTITGDGGDVIDGGEGGTDDDTLVVSGVDRIDFNPQNTENGTVFFDDGTSLDFTNIETVTVTERDGTVSGTSGDDTIDGSYVGDPDGDIVDNNDAILPGDANNDDLIEAGAGNDTILAGDGNDEVYAGTGNDLAAGGAGDDTLFGEAGADTLDGGAGNDIVRGDDADDTVLASDGFGVDVVIGGETGETVGDLLDAGANTYTGAGGVDVVTGTTQDTTLSFSGDEAGTLSQNNDPTGNTITFAEIERVRLGAGADTVFGGVGADDVDMGDGDDTFFLETGFNADIITGGEGGETTGDLIDSSAVSANTTVDFSGAETGTLNDGTDAASFFEIEEITTGAGDDLVLGDVGNDRVNTGAGADSLDGGAGNDVFDAGAGNDTLDGGTGRDTLLGGDGDDIFVLDDASGSDTITGGEGAEVAGGDTLDATGMTTDKTLQLNADGAGFLFDGSDNIRFAEIEDINLGSGNDFVNALTFGGTANVDTGAGNDTYAAGAGDDTATLGVGNDTLNLSNLTGDDTIAGGENAGDLDRIDAANQTAPLTVDFSGAETGTITNGTGTATFDEFERITTGSGNDTILGDVGDDYLITLGGDDTATLGAGNDTIFAGTGNDTIDGGTGNDRLDGGDDRDTFIISDNFGDDSITGGNGGDNYDTLDLSGLSNPVTVLFTGPGAGTITDQVTNEVVRFSQIEHLILTNQSDVVDAEDDNGNTFIQTLEGDDSVLGSFGDDVYDDEIGTGPANDGAGSDIFFGGAGNDEIRAGNDDDQLFGGVGLDTLEGQDGDDTIDGGSGNDTLLGGSGDDLFELTGTYGDDFITGGELGETAGDVVDASSQTADMTVVFSGDEAGTISAGASNAGFEEIEQIITGSGDDSITGGIGADNVQTGAGNDTISLSDGDSMDGGSGDDTFTLTDTPGGPGAPITITGGSGDETGGDTLDLGDLANLQDVLANAVDDGTGSYSGSVTLDDGTLLSFSEIENIICFTPGTRVATPQGARDIADLQVGDLVVTRDHGLQPIRWIQSRTVPALDRFAPVRIRPGVVTGQARDLLVSPQHRMLFQGYRAELLFGETEVLIAAKHLIDGVDVTQDAGGDVTYIHMMFDQHEVVYAEGAATESFHPGSIGLSAIADEAREELFTLFPDLRSNLGGYGDTARRCLKRHEAELLRV